MISKLSVLWDLKCVICDPWQKCKNALASYILTVHDHRFGTEQDMEGRTSISSSAFPSSLLEFPCFPFDSPWRQEILGGPAFLLLLLGHITIPPFSVYMRITQGAFQNWESDPFPFQSDSVVWDGNQRWNQESPWGILRWVVYRHLDLVICSLQSSLCFSHFDSGSWWNGRGGPCWLLMNDTLLAGEGWIMPEWTPANISWFVIWDTWGRDRTALQTTKNKRWE